jgi:BNR repeat-like domain
VTRAAGLLILTVLLAAGCGGAKPGAQQVSSDPLSDKFGQHETAVEPDSLAAGGTVVAVFQVGRSVRAGASATGYATSTDGGKSWQSGLLPGLTVNQPERGRFNGASDPVLAHDDAHDSWLAASLALRRTRVGFVISLLVNRSRDGKDWSEPVVVFAGQEGTFPDKDWVTCGGGRCYALWTLHTGTEDLFATSTSSDGGATWSKVRTLPFTGFGYQPLVHSDGTITLVYLAGDEENGARVEARQSSDGLATLSEPTVIGTIRSKPILSARTGVLPAAESRADGQAFAVWRDCRFRPSCAHEGIVLSSSADSVHWSAPRPVPTPRDADAILPAVAVSQSHVAVLYTVLRRREVATYVVASANDGRTWSAPHELSKPTPLAWFPKAGPVRFLGDYDGASYLSDGRVVGVFANAAEPDGAQFRQGIYAAVADTP